MLVFPLTCCDCELFHHSFIFFFFCKIKRFKPTSIFSATGIPQCLKHTANLNTHESKAVHSVQSSLFFSEFTLTFPVKRGGLPSPRRCRGGRTALTWLLQSVAPYPRRSISRTIKSHSCENCLGHMRGWTSIESALKRSAVTQTGRLCGALHGRTGTRWLERARRLQTDVCLSAWRGEKEQNIRRR